MKNIFLIGFMGAGKSTVARALRAATGLPVLEMDSELERRAGMTVSQFFAARGEAAFRQMETDLITGLEASSPWVVSCGGGVPMRQVNVDAMRERGCIVLLTARPETILARVSSSHDRPLLEGRKNVEYITELMEARRPHYEAAADLTVSTDGKSAQAIAREICRALKGRDNR